MFTLHKLTATLSCLMLVQAGILQAEQVVLDVSPAYKLLKADLKQTTWFRVGLTGFELKTDKERSPVNIALVLDRSGSMQGDSLERAKEAAINAIQRLSSEDIVSVITYDSTVNVLVPATKLSDKQYVVDAISTITAGGSTALFAGVSKGAAEIRKFIDKEHVNRIILLSDGKANSGPSSPGELGALGASLHKENISVSTLGLGLGYNEDLMVKLASRSGGNHEFVEDAGSLTSIFDREFDDVTSVVAQEVNVNIDIPEGIRPVRVLGNEAEINGQNVIISLSQIYSEQNKHVVIEVEVPASELGSELKLGTVSVSYKNMQSQAIDTLTGSAKVKFSDSEAAVEASINGNVWTDVVVLVSNEKSKLATIYLDQGDLAKCQEVLTENGRFLKVNSYLCPPSPKLEAIYSTNAIQQQQVEANDVNRARKSMRDVQGKLDANRSLSPAPSPAPSSPDASSSAK